MRSILKKGKAEFAYRCFCFATFQAPILPKEFVGTKSDKLLVRQAARMRK